jgi:hypothetical protein
MPDYLVRQICRDECERAERGHRQEVVDAGKNGPEMVANLLN